MVKEVKHVRGLTHDALICGIAGIVGSFFVCFFTQINAEKKNYVCRIDDLLVCNVLVPFLRL